MKLGLLSLLLFIGVSVFSQTHTVNIKGFGDISATKISENKYDLDFGKYGIFRATGSLDPLGINIKTTREELREFPGYKLYEKMDLQEVEIDVSQEGLKIAGSVDTQKNFGELCRVFKIPNPSMEVAVAVSKTSFELEGGLDFEEDPIVVDVIPDFSRFTLENFGIGAEWAAGDGELELTVAVSIQNRWKPTQWDPDIQSVTAFSYNLMSQEISASISMTDTWRNPFLLSEFFKDEETVVFSNVAAAVDWPLGAPAPSGFGFNVGMAKFFDLEFATQLAVTPTDKKVAAYASRNQITMNDFSRIMRNGFGLKVPDIFPEDIYIKDVEILFSPNGGEVGEFDIDKGFTMKGNAKFMDAVEAKLDFYANTEEGFHLYYKMDASFKQYFERELRNHPKIKFIADEVLKRMEVHKVELEANADMDLNMDAKTYCKLSVMEQPVEFSIQGAFSAQALVDKATSEILRIAGPEAAAVVEAVGKGVREAGKMAGAVVGGGANVAKKYVELAKIKRHHLGHSVEHCRSNCVPARARELGNPALASSKGALKIFQDEVIDDLARIKGDNPDATRQLREELFLAEWNELNRKIEEDWRKVWEDGRYVGFFTLQGDAKAGGVLYREKVNQIKQSYLQYKDEVYNNLVSAGFSDNAEFTSIQNRWKGTKINIGGDAVVAGNNPEGSNSSDWIVERVPDSKYVKLKNRANNTYLHIENGKPECTEIAPGWHSAQWFLEKVGETGYVKIQNRWKGTYLNVESGHLECSEIESGWHSAQWEMSGPYIADKAWNIQSHQAWKPGEVVLVSPNGKYQLEFTEKGDLVIKKYGVIEVWSSGSAGAIRMARISAGLTSKPSITGLRFEKGGYLVVHYGPKTVWSSNSNGKNGEALVMQDDGNLVIHAPGANVIWASNSYERTYTNKSWNTNGDQVFHPGQTVLKSNNKIYSLVFQEDGNLVLYKYDTEAIWSSGTYGKGAKSFSFQGDGNMCIRTDPNTIIWASNSYDKNGEALVVQDDGNMVIHAPGANVIWSSNTAGR